MVSVYSCSETIFFSMKGTTFRDKIVTAIRSSSFFMDHLLPFNVTVEGAELYGRYHDIAASSFSAYLEEIRGMAEGARLTYSEVGVAYVHRE